jgi:hypothetical protein
MSSVCSTLIGRLTLRGSTDILIIADKATDENLTTINWEYMMDAWDKVNDSGESGYVFRPMEPCMGLHFG